MPKNKPVPDVSGLDTLGLHLTGEAKMPTRESVWKLYTKAQAFNNAINLEETVKVNENFFIGE